MKKIQRNEKLEHGINMFLTFAIGFLMGVMGMAFASCGARETSAQELMLQRECAERTQIQGAYSDVLHRVWIDQPQYVEDILWETEEFLRLDSLLQGDWEDTFDFWSAEDSIEYELHWQHIDNVLRHRSVEPDVPSKKPVLCIDREH